MHVCVCACVFVCVCVCMDVFVCVFNQPIIVLFCFSVEVTESFYNGLCPEVTTTALTSVLSCDCMEGHSASCSATANTAGCESSIDGGRFSRRMLTE